MKQKKSFVLILHQSKSYCFHLILVCLSVMLEINIFLFRKTSTLKKRKKIVFSILVSVGKQTHDKKDKQEPHTWQQ